MLEEFYELVTTDSASGDERLIADKLKEKLAAIGCEVFEDPREAERVGGNTGNVYAVLEGEGEGSILFCSHMDRVANGRGIRPVERDGRLFAQGTILAADDIAGVCAILDGLRRLKASARPHPRIEVLFTVFEEDGMRGSKAADLSRIRSRIGYVFDSGGRIGRIINEATSKLDVSIRAAGKAAHAGNAPEKGASALYAAALLLSRLPHGRIDAISTANFSNFAASGPNNVVSDAAELSGEMRSLDFARCERWLDTLRDTAADVTRETGVSFDVRAETEFRHFRVPPESRTVRIAEAAFSALGIPTVIESVGGGMDANILAEAGIECIGLATGYFDNHTPRESLVIDDFLRTGELAAAIAYAAADVR